MSSPTAACEYLVPYLSSAYIILTVIYSTLAHAKFDYFCSSPHSTVEMLLDETLEGTERHEDHNCDDHDWLDCPQSNSNYHPPATGS